MLNTQQPTIGNVLEFDLAHVYSDPQWEAITWDPRAEFWGMFHRLPIEVQANLGDYGGGKTFATVSCAARTWLANPFDADFGHTSEAPPMSGLCGPTLSDIMAGPYVELHKVLDDELILHERLYHPYMDIRLVNGHLIKLYTAKGAINGPTLCSFTPVEIQDRAYASILRNIQMRCRDGRSADMYRSDVMAGKPPEARRGRLSFIVDGLPEVGHVEDVFRDPQGIDRKTTMFSTASNIALAEGVEDAIQRSLPASSRARDPDGWTKKEGLVWPMFTRDNIVPMSELKDRYGADEDKPTHAGIDFRSSGAVVLAQPIEVELHDGTMAPAMALVAQWMPDDISAERMAETLSVRCDWNLDNGRSTFTYDPTASQDEVNHFRRCFPSVKRTNHKRFGKQTRLWKVAAGEAVVDWAVEDFFGNRRLLVAEELLHESKRGVIQALRNWDGKSKTLEHAADAIRYVVMTHIRPPRLTYKDQDPPVALTPSAISRTDDFEPGLGDFSPDLA